MSDNAAAGEESVAAMAAYDAREAADWLATDLNPETMTIAQAKVLKNFPTPEQALATMGPRARLPQWTARTHYWVLQYELA
jgi:hypothetical protein